MVNFAEYNRRLAEVTGLPTNHFIYKPLEGFAVVSGQEFTKQSHSSGAWGHYHVENGYILLNAKAVGEDMVTRTDPQAISQFLWHLVAHENTHRLDPQLETRHYGGHLRRILEEGTAELVTRLVEKKVYGTALRDGYGLETLSIYALTKLVGRKEYFDAYFNGKNMLTVIDTYLGEETAKTIDKEYTPERIAIKILQSFEAKGGDISTLLAEAECDADVGGAFVALRNQKEEINGFVFVNRMGKDKLGISYFAREVESLPWARGHGVIFSVQDGYGKQGGSLPEIENVIHNEVYAPVVNAFWWLKSPSMNPSPDWTVDIRIGVDEKKLFSSYSEAYVKANPEERIHIEQTVAAAMTGICCSILGTTKKMSEEEFRRIALEESEKEKTE